MGLKLLILKKLSNSLKGVNFISPGPVFWKGKDITGKYHDKKELRELLKKKDR
jgi:hypothetical protein